MGVSGEDVLSIEGDRWIVSIDVRNYRICFECKVPTSRWPYRRCGKFIGRVVKWGSLRHIKNADGVYALQRYITKWSRDLGKVFPSLVNDLIYYLKLFDESRCNLLYAEPLALGISLMIKYFSELSRADVITYVPLHQSELRLFRVISGEERLVNHVYEIAKMVSGHVGKPLINALVKVRPLRMSKLNNVARRFCEVKELYKPRERADLRGLRVILIDDIITTGATMNECARVLKECLGAEKVYAVVAGVSY